MPMNWLLYGSLGCVAAGLVLLIAWGAVNGFWVCQ